MGYFYSDQNINCMRTTPLLLFFLLLLSSTLSVNAQTRLEKEVSGTVTDTKGAMMSGVSINEKGSQRGTVTDANGFFKLRVTGKSPALVASYVGYEDQEIKVG